MKKDMGYAKKICAQKHGKKREKEKRKGKIAHISK